ncbi:hypothetical protein ALC62_05488 [Cyphomyrmex costatus]|uniref:Uncharacterized protein n=1 Tax=Cyphomyrmex costatus TaxID=456900 RepID=A0A195CSX0_9HYME|nr:hypothetical protein ALC62_05488 [Cyphomyrmex costatus]
MLLLRNIFEKNFFVSSQRNSCRVFGCSQLIARHTPDFAAKRFCVRFAGVSPLPFQGSTVKADGSDDDDDRTTTTNVVLSLIYVPIYVRMRERNRAPTMF